MREGGCELPGDPRSLATAESSGPLRSRSCATPVTTLRCRKPRKGWRLCSVRPVPCLGAPPIRSPLGDLAWAHTARRSCIRRSPDGAEANPQRTAAARQPDLRSQLPTHGPPPTPPPHPYPVPPPTYPPEPFPPQAYGGSGRMRIHPTARRIPIRRRPATMASRSRPPSSE